VNKTRWNRADAEIALELFNRLLLENINRVIPGKTYDWDFKIRRFIKKGIQKTTIIKTIKWIVDQTHGFKVPLMVNFLYGEAAVVGYCLAKVFDVHLPNALYEQEKNGIRVPTVASGWHHGPDKCYIMISNLQGSRGKQGYSLEGVTIINIHGEMDPGQRTVQYKDIVS